MQLVNVFFTKCSCHNGVALFELQLCVNDNTFSTWECFCTSEMWSRGREREEEVVQFKQEDIYNHSQTYKDMHHLDKLCQRVCKLSM